MRTLNAASQGSRTMRGAPTPALESCGGARTQFGAYPAGYIEQLARLFRDGRQPGERRALAARLQRREQRQRSF